MEKHPNLARSAAAFTSSTGAARKVALWQEVTAALNARPNATAGPGIAVCSSPAACNNTAACPTAHVSAGSQQGTSGTAREALSQLFQ
ncbi:hypothetical protein MTO96_049798 [Rhipicephalus appendiculatus]